MKNDVIYTIEMKSDGVARDFDSREKLFETIYEFFGIEEANYVDEWLDAAGVGETYDGDVFSVVVSEPTWDIKTINELVERLKKHYPRSPSVCNTIDKVASEMIEKE